jgi:hypothetical protein
MLLRPGPRRPRRLYDHADLFCSQFCGVSVDILFCFGYLLQSVALQLQSSCIASVWLLNGQAPAEAAAGAGCRRLLRRSSPRRSRPPRPHPARSSASPLWTSSSLWSSQQNSEGARRCHDPRSRRRRRCTRSKFCSGKVY